MGVLAFIFSIFATVIGGVVALCIIAMIWDTKKLEQENAKLKEDLKKAKARYLKREYKKAKEVKK